MQDADDINAIYAEEWQYRKWEREQKNRILSLWNVEKKKKEWERIFGTKKEPDDSYLDGEVF